MNARFNGIGLAVLLVLAVACFANSGVAYAACVQNICTETMSVGGQNVNVEYTQYVQPNGKFKIRIDGGTYINDGKLVSYLISGLPSFSAHGVYGDPNYLPSESVNPSAYERFDSDGVSGDMDQVMWITLNGASLGAHSFDLSITQHGDSTTKTGLTFNVANNAPSNENEAQEMSGVITNPCSSSMDEDLDYARDCADQDCNGISRCEYGHELTCNDGFNNDAEDGTDCQDIDCNNQQGTGGLCQYNDETGANCADGFDNDVDGAIDCLDTTTCWKNGVQCPATETCGNGQDDDYDSNYNDNYDALAGTGIDCADYDCRNNGCPARENQLADGTPAPMQCFDGVDNDLDDPAKANSQLYRDCADPDCNGVANPQTGRICYANEYVSGSLNLCNNGVDDDGDGAQDCADPDCKGMFGNCGPCPAVEDMDYHSCADSVDNDLDSATDCADGDCAGMMGSFANAGKCEYQAETSCGDGFDNDRDGATDCADSNCAGHTGPQGQTCGSEMCGDGLDNDGDGLRDCVDPDCFGSGACAAKSWNTVSCATVPDYTGFTNFAGTNPTVSAKNKKALYAGDTHSIEIVGTSSYSNLQIWVGSNTVNGDKYPFDARTCTLSGSGASSMDYFSDTATLGKISKKPGVASISNFDVTLTCSGTSTPLSSPFLVELLAELSAGGTEQGKIYFTASAYETTPPTVSGVEVGGIVSGVVEDGTIYFRGIPSDASGICGCSLSIGGTNLNSDGNCIASMAFTDDVPSLAISARARDGASNLGGYSATQYVEVNVLPKVTSSLTIGPKFYRSSGSAALSVAFATAASGSFVGMNGVCPVIVRDASGAIASQQTIPGTTNGNAITCAGTITMPGADGQYTAEVTATDEDGDAVTSNKQVFYRCDALSGVCQYADFDQDYAAEGMPSVKGLVCDNCPTMSNMNQLDTNDDGIGNDCTVLCSDGDADGYNAFDATFCPTGDDCNDGDRDVNPGATESCNNVDDDCDGQTDEGGVCPSGAYYCDSDGDGHNSAAMSGECSTYNCTQCSRQQGDDCDDHNGAVNPDAIESCNGIDDDCDQEIDEQDASGCTVYYADNDADSYGNASTRCLCAAESPYNVTRDDDCDDGDAGVNPAASETCNGMDDDCDGGVDEGVKTTFYADNDGDGYGDLANTAEACAVPGGYVSDSTDCNDANDAIHPGADEECNGVDDNCVNGVEDEIGICPAGSYYCDTDEDGYISAAPSGECNTHDCVPSGCTRDPGDDCDDANDAVHPNAEESCNGIDDNCNSDVDEENALGCSVYHADRDLDAYGNPLDMKCLCSAAAPYVTVDSTDCDDTNDQIHPNGDDTQCNGVDEDCDMTPDDGYVAPPTSCGTGYCSNSGALVCENGGTRDTCTPKPPPTMYRDADSDGFGDASVSTQNCMLLDGYVFDSTDCNDQNGLVNPSGIDICDASGNVIDRDCDSATRPNCADYCGDADMDGYVTADRLANWDLLHSIICPWVITTSGSDCREGDAASHPGAAEVCDLIDNNCDGKVDEGCAGVDKQDALAALLSLSTPDSKSRDELNKGIKELRQSLGNLDLQGDKKIYWLDNSHLFCKHGYKAFDDEEKAVHHLLKVADPAIKSQVAGAVSAIVNADRKVALTAITEAPAGKDKDKAMAKFNKAEAETKPEHKIHYYRSAWKYVNKHCDKNIETSCIEDITLLSPNGFYVDMVGDDISPKTTAFTDPLDESVTLDTSCKKCVKVGQAVKGWTVTDMVANSTLSAVCAVK